MNQLYQLLRPFMNEVPALTVKKVHVIEIFFYALFCE